LLKLLDDEMKREAGIWEQRWPYIDVRSGEEDEVKQII
jgi:hypothetical protein